MSGESDLLGPVISIDVTKLSREYRVYLDLIDSTK